MSAFHDRTQAGRMLASRLTAYAGRNDVLVLALPRGGVPVAYEVARALDAPLDVYVVRKLGVPGQEELALGAIASGGVRVLNRDVVRALHIGEAEIDAIAAREQIELDRREKLYRGDRQLPNVAERTVILVDDGLATGATMRAAVQALRQLGPDKLVVAVPTGAPETCADLEREVDDLVCLISPEPFYGVGFWYDHFAQTPDAEVTRLLREAAVAPRRSDSYDSPPDAEHT